MTAEHALLFIKERIFDLAFEKYEMSRIENWLDEEERVHMRNIDDEIILRCQDYDDITERCSLEHLNYRYTDDVPCTI